MDVVVELVKVAHDLVESEGQVAAHVLESQQWRPEDRDGVGYVRPEVTFVVSALALSGVTERLTWIPSGQDVDAWDGVPVGGGEVAVVGDAGVVVIEDGGGGLVELDVPEGLAAEDRLDAELEARVAGAHGAVGEAHDSRTSCHVHQRSSLRVMASSSARAVSGVVSTGVPLPTTTVAVPVMTSPRPS
jgi:hypothetical protein